MKTIHRSLLTAFALILLTFSSPAVTIYQGASDTFVAFEAEHIAYVSNAPPTSWVVTNDAPASGGRALYQAGLDQQTGFSVSFAYYQIKFTQPGTYTCYVRWRGDKARTDQDVNGANSYRVPSDFGDLPNDGTSSLFPVSSANNTRVPPEANNYAMIREALTYTVTPGQVDAGIPLIFKIGVREWGMFLDRFIFSQNGALTEADFNATPDSETSIIQQGPGENYLAFEAERVSLLSNAPPTSWVVTNDVPASGGQALYQAGGDQQTGFSVSFAYYKLRFTQAGTYTAYVRWRGDKVRTDQDVNGANSYRVPSDFGDLPNDGTSSLFPVSSANNTRVPPEANNYAMIREALVYTVTQQQVDAGEPLLFKIGVREWGMFLDRFILSQNGALTEAEFNATPNSGAGQRPEIAGAVGSASLDTVTITFTVPLSPFTVDPSAFTISGGLTIDNAVPDPNDPKIVRLTTSPQVQGSNYVVTVTGVADPNSNEILPGSTVRFTAWKLAPGWLTREYYFSVSGADVASLMASPKYPNSPDSIDLVRGIEFENTPWIDNYGVRFTTYFSPSVSESYDFYIYSDDEAQLFLSTDTSPANLQLLVDSPCCTSAFNSQLVGISPGPLEAGQRYLLQVLLKQATSETRLNVAARPSSQNGEPVDGLTGLSGNQLAAFVNPDLPAATIVQQPQPVATAPGTRARFAVAATSLGGSLFYQWQVNGVDIPGATRSVFFTPVLTPSDSGKQYRVLIRVAGTTATSASALLTVAGAPVHAAVDPYIGVNFTGGGGGATGGAAGLLQPLDVAGVVAQQHFNNIRGTSGNALELTDASGALSPVHLSFQSAALSSTGTGDSDADRSLLQGYIHNNNSGSVTVTLSEVPDGAYNLYVYSLGFNFNSIFDQAYTLVGLTTPPTFHVTAEHAGDYAAAPGYRRASSTDPGARDKGNYVVFENVSPDFSGVLALSVTSEATVAGINFMPAVNGLQLAAVNTNPALTIALNGDKVDLSWGADAAGYTLEATPSLDGPAPAAWATVVTAPSPLPGAGSISLAATGLRYFRLRR